MRLSPLPLLFAPGIGLIGFLIAGAAGAQVALAAWVLLVGAASIWTLLRDPRRKGVDPSQRR